MYLKQLKVIQFGCFRWSCRKKKMGNVENCSINTIHTKNRYETPHGAVRVVDLRIFPDKKAGRSGVFENDLVLFLRPVKLVLHPMEFGNVHKAL